MRRAIRQACFVAPLAELVAEDPYREPLAELGDHEDRADRWRRQNGFGQAGQGRRRPRSQAAGLVE